MQLVDRASITATDIEEIAGLRALWAETLGDPRILIAFLDGPIDRTHPALVGAKLALASTSDTSVGRGFALCHGTQVASIILGQRNGYIQGIAPRCRGLIVPVISDRADGSFASYSQLGLAQAIALAVQAGANIINISLGQYSADGVAHPLLVKAVNDCVACNVLIVAAVGNEGHDGLSIPAALPSVLAVGAMDSQGVPLEFSNWGEKYRTQGILAIGENIPTANSGGDIAISSGTSYATPIVSGVVALLASLQLERGFRPNLRAIREAILRSATGCEAQSAPDCRRLLAGRLNIDGAKSLMFQGVSTMPNVTETPVIGQPTADIDHPGKSSQIYFSNEPAQISTDRYLPFSMDASAFTTGTSLIEGAPRTAVGIDCNCGGGLMQWVFALGKLGYDFGTEARRDSIRQHMQQPAPGFDPNPHDPAQLLSYLQDNSWEAAAIIWTLNLDATPIYAIKSCGAFAREIYERLRDFLHQQLDNAVERVSIPGRIAGNVRLMNGQVVPVIQPDRRGMYSWRTDQLIDLVSKELGYSESEQDELARCKERVGNFFVRAYEELRNLGISPQDRALNYSATNAMLVAQVFKEAIKENLVLGKYEVERSPVCRPESDCWDVKLTFFNPSKIFEQASKVYLFTVDVGDVVPVMVGKVRSWFVYVRP